MTQPDDQAAAPANDESVAGTADERPDWWLENEQLRAEMGLPAYRPPRFSDGTYTHRVTEPLEDEYGCRLRFVGANTRYPEDWEVRVDGEPAFAIGRHRDEGGNTVYELSADEFEAAVERVLAERAD